MAVYTALGGKYPKYNVSGVDGSGRDRGSTQYFETREEVDEYVKELKDLNKFIVIYIHIRETKAPKKGYVLTRAPEYRLLKEYKLTSKGWK
jgi:hypothetical protein